MNKKWTLMAGIVLMLLGVHGLLVLVLAWAGAPSLFAAAFMAIVILTVWYGVYKLVTFVWGAT